LFEISPNDGKVYCHPGVDREVHGQYILQISATGGTHRLKRSLGSEGM